MLSAFISQTTLEKHYRKGWETARKAAKILRKISDRKSYSLWLLAGHI
jgi:hypothetical protein